MISLPKAHLATVAKTVARAPPAFNRAGLYASEPASTTVLKGSKPVVQSPPLKLTSYSLSKDVSFLGAPRAASSIAGGQVRWAHTDIAKVPDFSHCRIKVKLDPKVDREQLDEDSIQRKTTSYIMSGASAVAGVYTAKYFVRMMLGHFQPDASVMALSKVEIKLNAVPEGRSMTFKWRGKPLFIRHRTDEEIAREVGTNWQALRDPQEDKDRATNPKFLILIGVCTHLGCVPIADAGEFAGGYYCPCHGSHYDGSGRIRKGPAPLNLEIPYYEFTEEGTVIVGE